MIRNIEPINLVEIQDILDKTKENEGELLGFVKKFTKLKPTQSKDLRNKIEALDLIKIDEKHINKLIELLPKNKEDINQIFSDVSLNEDEIQKLLDTIKEFN